MDKTPNISSTSHSPTSWHRTEVPRQLLETRDGTDAVGRKSVGDSCEQIDTALRQLSKQETNIQERFAPGKPRTISQASFPEGVKAAKHVFSNRDFNQQMDSIGSHRRRKG